MAAKPLPEGWQSAHTAETANQIASRDVVDAINKLSLPTQQRKWIADQWAELHPNSNLHKNCQTANSGGWGALGPVVQVDTAFVKKGAGNTYRVDIMLDVDDPPSEESSQPPHFGWEVHLDSKRAANGHVALPPGVLVFGRTFKGKDLNTYGYSIGDNERVAGAPQGMEVELSFKRYK